MDTSNLNLQQTLEGMPLTFNAESAANLNATIQFDVSGDEPGVYHLSISNGECHFHKGAADSPTLTIATPSDIWIKISRGELSGQDALMQGLYTASGDLSLMLKMDALFGSASDTSYEAPSDQRPAGPIAIPGMAWMSIAFIPWIIHWSTFDIPGISHWISIGLPLLISTLIVGYRLKFDRPTFMEWGGLGFFTLSGALALTGSPDYTHWGSIVSTLVMAGLWLSSIQFAKMPLSGEYSKWCFIKGLWGNSMFIYPNAVISLMWGWQFIVATMLGIAAILLPEQMLVLTISRYLLLIPAFIFTSSYQKRVPIPNPRFTDANLNFLAGLGLSAISGLLLTSAMPGFDVPFLGWIALIPLLMVLITSPVRQHYALALPFGLLLSIGVHNWYPNIFPPALGYFLIFAVGTFYAGMLQLGSWLYTRLSGGLKLLAFPVAWVAIEFVRFIAPVVEDWWFVLLAKSAWRFPPALQILSVTGFVGLSFILMLANVTVAMLILDWRAKNSSSSQPSVISRKSALIGLGIVVLTLLWGVLIIPKASSDTIKVASITDMFQQDMEIAAYSETDIDEPIVKLPEVSQVIFDVNAELTRLAAEQGADIVIWAENEFTDVDDETMISQLSALAQKTSTYIVADVVWYAESGLHDTALIMGPDGREVGRWPKTRLFSAEAKKGFDPGPGEFPVVDTNYGAIGSGICYDYHYLDVARNLATNGAKLLLMPTDDDFNGTPWFPPFHSSDGVFRAVEHRASFANGSVNGLSLVVDPYGRITAEGRINERGVIVGETFTVEGQTLYTRLGDWFGWLMVVALTGLVIVAIRLKE